MVPAMEKEFIPVDRTGWAAGPWDHEGDREEWVTAAGLPGLINRSLMGAWCGYVAVAPAHPWHGKDYYDIGEGIQVHGALTYSGACRGHICHVPAPGEPDNVWWFGFDCSHFGDLAPGLDAALGGRLQYPADVHQTYRNADFARDEVELLALQLVGVGRAEN